MENSPHARAGSIDGGLVGDIGLDELHFGIAPVLIEIGATAHDETVEHAHAPALPHQAVDKMTADESRTTGDQVKV
jgi:hypothetical protein